MTRLRALRVLSGETQVDTARQLQVVPSWYAQVERGAVPVSDRLKARIETKFGLPWSQLSENVSPSILLPA